MNYPLKKISLFFAIFSFPSTVTSPPVPASEIQHDATFTIEIILHRRWAVPGFLQTEASIPLIIFLTAWEFFLFVCFANSKFKSLIDGVLQGWLSKFLPSTHMISGTQPVNVRFLVMTPLIVLFGQNGLSYEQFCLFQTSSMSDLWRPLCFWEASNAAENVVAFSRSVTILCLFLWPHGLVFALVCIFILSF